jgi:predicted MFS family arabinose efflux permease
MTNKTRLPPVLWALMAGNFVVGTGVMVVPGTLNEISSSLQVSVPTAGQLLSAGALVVGLGAPLLAGLVAGWDRRRLLALSMAWYALLLALSALAPSYASLMALRILTMLTPAIFTPQAAACVGLLVPPEQRGRAVTFIFLGWSIASVLGMPLGAWVGGHYGWRTAFGLVAACAAISAVWVWRAMPNGIRPAALSLEAWAGVLRSPALMLAIAVTLLSASGQFALFAYMAPMYKETLGASPDVISALFFWFGLFGLIGNIWMSRNIDRLGTPRAVLITLATMALSLAIWPLGTSPWLVAIILIPWGLGCFASNSAQQARLVNLGPSLAPATIALNTSAMYAGQAIGAASGGWVIAQGAMGQLHWLGFGVLVLAMGVSVWAGRASKQSSLAAEHP